jgi:hypothetical protein
MEELAGSAHVSFEGDLSKTKLAMLPGVSVAETGVLKRNTTWPQQDFLVLPLEPEDTGKIIAAIGGSVPSSVLHIQIEKYGKLELGIYDKGHSTFFGVSLQDSFLNKLEGQGTISPLHSLGSNTRN